MTTTRKTEAPTRRPVAYVFAEFPRCPSCGSRRVLAYRTVKQDDDSLLRFTRCADCGERFKIVWE